MLKLLLGTGIFALSFGMAAFADTVDSFDSVAHCQPLRLDLNGDAFEHIPTYNQAAGVQSDPDICYAITAAELIDANRFRSGDRLSTLTSPLSVALNTRLHDFSSENSKFRASSLDDSDPVVFMVGGGMIDDALKANQGANVCDQRWLESKVKLMTDENTALPIDQYLLTYPGTRTAVRNSELIESAIAGLNLTCKSNLFSNSYPQPMKLELPGGNMLDANMALVAKLQDHTLSPAEKKRLVANFYLLFDPERNIQMFGNQINALMDGPAPHAVGIGYIYAALQAVDHPGSIGGHASVLIGRRISPISGRCEYLVRDSYGSNCKDKSGNDRYSLPCESGSVWVDARELMRQTQTLSWIP